MYRAEHGRNRGVGEETSNNYKTRGMDAQDRYSIISEGHTNMAGHKAKEGSDVDASENNVRATSLQTEKPLKLHLAWVS